MKHLIWLLLLPGLASAEIYKCKENGKTIFSDAPCGDSAKIIEVKPLEKTGTKLTSDAMEDISGELGEDRQRRKLDSAIERQQKKIERMADTYNKKLSSLQEKLAEHKSKYDYHKFKSHPSKKKRYQKKSADLRNQMKDIKRKYKTDKQLAYDKLYELKSQRRRLR